MKRFLALLICAFVTVLYAVPVSADLLISPSATAHDFESELHCSISLEVTDGKYVRAISIEDMQSIRESIPATYQIQSEASSNYGAKILSAMGYDDLELKSFSNEDLQKITLQAGSIISTSSYYRLNNLTKEATLITEEEFLEGIEESECNKDSMVASISSGGESSTLTGDGYFEINSTAIYYPDFVYDEFDGFPEDGWFSFSGIVTFHDAVPLGYEDAISLSIDPAIVAWDDYDSAFSSTMVRVDNQGNETTTYKTTTDRYINTSGAYYVWNPMLSNGISSVSISMRGLGRVCNYSTPQNFSLYVGYVYTQTTSDVQFSWSVPLGISISPSFQNSASHYYGHCLVRYNP